MNDILPGLPNKTASELKISANPDIENELNASLCEGEFRIIDAGILREIVEDCACPSCKDCKLSVEEKPKERKGLSNRYYIICHACGYEKRYYTSNRVQSERNGKGGAPFEVNARFTLTMRNMGKGHSDIRSFCGIMNMPPPMTEDTYQKLHGNLHNAAVKCSQESMSAAALELGQQNNKDVTIMIGGTWQKRGHTSINGVVTCISMESRKVLDCEVLSKVCKGCDQMQNKDKESAEYVEWQLSHDRVCKKSYEGSSGNMEPVGAKKIFGRSENLYNLRYLGYVGDGDTKSFDVVVESDPYPGHKITKKECVGHVQKRMGTQLPNLKQKSGKNKLSDGKTMGGRGSLTAKEIDNIQLYYGLAIRRNTGNLDGMKKDINAILKHKASTNTSHDHSLCPEGQDSWCGFQKAKANGAQYDHKHSLPTAIIDAITPIFTNLSKESLLSKCLDGFTQNACESF